MRTNAMSQISSMLMFPECLMFFSFFRSLGGSEIGAGRKESRSAGGRKKVELGREVQASFRMSPCLELNQGRGETRSGKAD